MDKDILEIILKTYSKEATIEKILTVEGLPAVGKNLNFLSNVTRLNLKVVFGNGKVGKKSVIVKSRQESTKFQDSFNDKYETFKTEIMIYNTLTQIEELMEEFGDTQDVIWGKLIHHIGYKQVVLEDLKTLGFNMIERKVFYDLNHTLLAAHSLGRYHGLFKAIEQKGLAPQGLKPWFIFDNQEVKEYMYWDLMALVESVKKLWDPSWRPIVEKIKITKTQLMERLAEFVKLDETKFNVTNHGDCHKNNILFKYGWNNSPVAIRFLDFQVAHYGSPCIDLTYLLYLAVLPSVRRDNFDLILKTYHDSLVNTLDKYYFNGKKPNLQEIRDGMDKYYYVGLILCLTWFPDLLTSDKMDELRDYERAIATDGKEGYSDEIFKPDVLEKYIGVDLKAFVDTFCTDN